MHDIRAQKNVQIGISLAVIMMAFTRLQIISSFKKPPKLQFPEYNELRKKVGSHLYVQNLVICEIKELSHRPMLNTDIMVSKPVKYQCSYSI